MNQVPMINELEGIFGITIDDLRLRKNTKEMQTTIPPMMIFRVAEDFNLKIGTTEYSFLEDDVYIMQFNLYYSILGFLKQNNKENSLVPEGTQFKEIYKGYHGQDLTDKTLFIMSTSIGDTIFMLPVLKYLKEKYPTCKIVYAVSNEIRDLISCYPKGLVDKMYDGSLFIKKDIIEETDYQLYPNFIITKNEEAKTKNAYDIFKEYAGLNFDVKEYMPELLPKKYILNELRGKLPDKFVVIQLRASTGNRMLRTEKWRNIIPQIIDMGYDIVFLDDPNFHALYENEIINYFPNLKDHIWNLCKTTKGLKQTITIISQADAVIGIDSALIHIAACFKKPIVGIYGPFIPSVRLKYYSNCLFVIPDKDKVKCELFPCFFHQDELSMGHCDYVRFHDFPDCMEKIDENDIIVSLKEVLKEKNNGRL